MAKIFDRIDGYAEMSTEDKLKALEAMELEDNSSEIERLKNAVSKANSESAEWKRKHNALLSAEEQQKQEQAESLAAMQQELETLRKEKTVAKYTADYVKLGFDEKLAEETAKALADGDMVKVFANQSKANEALVKKTIADKLKDTPRGVGGQTGGGAITKEKFLSMGTKEQQEFIQNNPDWQTTLK